MKVIVHYVYGKIPSEQEFENVLSCHGEGNFLVLLFNDSSKTGINATLIEQYEIEP